MMIDWDLWHSVNELAFAGSYKAAAKRLGVNPTTIKRRKETLERKLGRHLFIKQGGQLVPTPACKMVLDEVDAAARHLESARLGMAPDREHNTWRKITITSVPYICDQLLSPAMNRLPAHRRLRIELVGQNRNLDLRGTRDADIALRLGPTSSDNVSAWHIADIEYSTYIFRNAAVGKCPWITLDRSYSHLKEVRLPEEHADGEGVRFTTSTMASIQGVIETGVAKGLLPDFIGAQNSKIMILKDHPTVRRPLWLMWRDDVEEEPHFQSVLVWILRETISSLRSTESAGELLRKTRS